MASTEEQTKTDTTPSRNESGSGSELTKSGTGRLQSERGNTVIADGVVAKVTGIAAREVGGVYDMGGAPARAIGNVSKRVGITDQRTQGVSVEVGEKQAAADLTIVVEYGESIPRVTDEVRDNVVRRIEGLCGLEVTEVNISVTDLHFPGDDEETATTESRVD